MILVWWALFALFAGFSGVRLEGAQYLAGNLVIAMENARHRWVL